MEGLAFSRVLPVSQEWDVIVAGSGPAGIAAAISAARDGARTLLVEAGGAAGGMSTLGMVPCWCYFSDHQKIINSGLAEKILRELTVQMPQQRLEPFLEFSDEVRPNYGQYDIDFEALKRLYDQLLAEAGVTVRFYTQICGLERDASGGIAALVAASKNGLEALRAKVYIDCTGDADLAAWAGAEFEKGDPQTGQLQPATLCFILSNVDDYAAHHLPCRDQQKYGWIGGALRANGYIHDNLYCARQIGPSTWGFNTGHVWSVDNTSADSTSRAMGEGRKIAAHVLQGLKEWHPAYANAFLVSTGGLLGVRETRRVIGDYYLTREDYMARRTFPDDVAYNSWYVDIHLSQQELQEKFDDTGRCARYAPGEFHGIPYRCLTPKGIPNLLVAGRCISTDRQVQGAVRVMPPCFSMGEAAGAAAVLAARAATVDVHTVDVQKLREILRGHGAFITG